MAASVTPTAITLNQPTRITAYPDLTPITINDFTPGIITGNFNGPVYSSAAPLGSASLAYRCIARLNVGLVPLPSYHIDQTKSFLSGAGPANLTCSDMQCFAGSSGPDVIAVGWSSANPTSFYYQIDVWTANTGYNNGVYSHGLVATSTSMGAYYWPNLAKAFWSAANNVVGVISFEPSITVASSVTTWVAVPNSSGTGNSQTGTIPGPPPLKSAYWGGRMVFMTPAPNQAGLFTLFDSLYTSDIQATTNIIGPEFFEPENGGQIGAWGSVSTGEFFIIYQGGGCVLIYGDIQNPSQAVYMPAVTGTGQAIGPAVPTSIGSVYVTDLAGAYVWNGGNTSQKISNQIPDNSLIRTPTNFAPGTFLPPLFGQSNIKTWQDWVMFPNNWLYDTITQSWWQIESQSVYSFQVYAGQAGAVANFYGTPANATVPSGGPSSVTVPLMQFNRNVPCSSYLWVSNPIAEPGSLLELAAVELCASNMTSTSCTVTITPTGAATSTIPAPINQNTSQSITFTIPPNTAAYRQAQPLGFRDYNIIVSVSAMNLTSNAAPTIHEITFGVRAQSSASP
jgi:hypothetical protein